MDAETHNLNENEYKVYKAAVKAAEKATGGDFGFGEDVVVPGMTKRQIAGYLSQLEQKDYLYFSDDGLKKCFTIEIEVE